MLPQTFCIKLFKDLLTLSNLRSNFLSTTIIAFFDGGSRGNPGIGGAGAWLYDVQSGSLFTAWSTATEAATNNQAEYSGLLLISTILSTFFLNNLAQIDIILIGDSNIIMKQLQGINNPVNQTYQDIIKHVKIQLSTTHSCIFQHFTRNGNKGADYLSNIAMDNYTSETTIQENLLNKFIISDLRIGKEKFKQNSALMIDPGRICFTLANKYEWNLNEKFIPIFPKISVNIYLNQSKQVVPTNRLTNSDARGIG